MMKLLQSDSDQALEMAMPGDNITGTVRLMRKIKMTEGSRFAIREGSRTIGNGNGTVVKIIK